VIFDLVDVGMLELGVFRSTSNVDCSFPLQEAVLPNIFMGRPHLSAS
jgi:hypothetical protein